MPAANADYDYSSWHYFIEGGLHYKNRTYLSSATTVKTGVYYTGSGGYQFGNQWFGARNVVFTSYDDVQCWASAGYWTTSAYVDQLETPAESHNCPGTLHYARSATFVGNQSDTINHNYPTTRTSVIRKDGAARPAQRAPKGATEVEGRHDLAVDDYPTNEFGQTYGSSGGAEDYSQDAPDLIGSLGIGDVFGYVLKSDMLSTKRVESIPLYDIDGRTVVGEFPFSGGLQEASDTE
jgi:hypothetical protein